MTEPTVTEPTVTGHLQSPQVAELTMLSVPRAQRGRGIGTATYLGWELSLPLTVERVILWVADTDGDGRPFGFWESLGFGVRYTADEPSTLSYDIAGWMHKGLHGHPTPPPHRLDPLETDDA